VVPLAIQNQLCAIAHEHGLAVHLDGARIFNAAIAQRVDAAAVAEHADSVMFCLSKGLSCPLGSLLVGSHEFIAKAERCRQRIGGNMRQAGVIAACGLVALETMIDRLATDHANAWILADKVNHVPGLRVDLESVQTNMVNVDHTTPGSRHPRFSSDFGRKVCWPAAVPRSNSASSPTGTTTAPPSKRQCGESAPRSSAWLFRAGPSFVGAFIAISC
jgi:threonine aldolase